MIKKLNRQVTSNPQNRPIKVLQFGEGNFLRAFVDWIIDILNEKTNFHGSVQIIQPLRDGTGSILNSQEGLFHVVLQGIQKGKVFKETRLITCVDSVVNPYSQYEKFLKTAENSQLQFIVSNTTEAGICFYENDQSVDQIAESFPGKLTAWLFHRYNFFNGSPEKGLIFMPCELIDKNGNALRATIQQFIKHWNLPKEFSVWIDKHNVFCNTLVDRIVPGYPKDTVHTIQEEIGYEDKLVVTAEPFHLWVIESDASNTERIRRSFPVENTDLQVKFVNDLTPYRTRKVRILNGAHTAMVPVAYLNGLRTVQESVENPFTGDFIKETIFQEIIPTLDLPIQELKEFTNDVIERFQNPFIRHELLSIALNSVSKFKVRVLPSLIEFEKRTGQLPAQLVTALVKLIAFYKGEWHSQTIPLNDTPEVLTLFAKAWETNDVEIITATILSDISLWGMDLTEVEGLQQQVSYQLNKTVAEGVQAMNIAAEG